MRIAFVTQWFPPEPGTVVAAAIADGLAERGHEVDVLTGFPNYPTGRLHKDFPLRPYRRDERSERVTVHRAPLYPSHDSSAVKRMANYLSHGVSASLVARRQLPRPDVWLTYSSPATAALPSLSAPARLRAPTFLMIQDLWPDSVSQSGFVDGAIGTGVNKALSSFCDWTYRRSTGIGVISPGMRDILIERGVPPTKIHFTPNWVDDAHLHPTTSPTDELRRSLGLPAGRLFMYAGNMGELQGLGPLVDAFGRRPDVNLALLGEGVAKASLESQVRAQQLRNVHFIDPKPTDVVGRYIAASDVQVVSLKDTALLRATMPSKVQGSLAAARPILAHAAGDVARLVSETQVGLATPPGDIAAAVEAIGAFAEMGSDALETMGRNARARYETDFSPAAGVDHLESMLMAGGYARRNS